MSTSTQLKTIPFVQLMKVCKKFIAKSEARPVLQNVHFDGEYFTATDSHQLLRVKADIVSDIPENVTLFDPKEMKVNNDAGNFPDVSRFISEYSNTTVLLNGNLKEFHNVISEIKKLNKGRQHKVVNFNFTKNYTNISCKYEKLYEKEIEQTGIEPDIFLTYENTINSLYVEGDEIKISASDVYLNNALETAKKLSKLSFSDVELCMNGRMRPIIIKQENVFDILVLPIRIY